MKKMLDELKKLDVEYEVPQDFRKKVMEQIKSEAIKAKEAPKKNKIVRLKKYVIACASVAAMFIVVVNVTQMGEKFAVQENAGASMDSVNFAPSISETQAIKESADLTNNVFDNFFKEDNIEMDTETSRTEGATANQKVILSVDTIEKELDKLEIGYEIVEKELFIAKEDLQKVKDTIDKEILDNIEFIEKDDKIQIIIK